jgi:hypothetical protein
MTTSTGSISSCKLDLPRNYWISFNDSTEDTVSEVTHTISSANIFYSHRLMAFMLANYFDEVGFEEVDRKYPFH